MQGKARRLAILLLGMGFCLMPLAGRADVAYALTYPVPAQVARGEADLPRILSDSDEALYRRIFALGAAGHWQAVDRLIGQVKDPLLLGHVLGQRYLDAARYRAQADELSAWLTRYGDHPEAAQIAAQLRAKARKGGARPTAAPLTPMPERGMTIGATPGETVTPVILPSAEDEFAAGTEALQLAGEIRALLETGAIAAAQRLLASPRAERLLSADDAVVLAGEIGEAAMEADACRSWPEECASFGNVSDSAWWAGLAAWREKRYGDAAQAFELVATRAERSPWLASAGAFWAARSHLVAGEPQNVHKWLTAASAFPRTFYGLLARRIVGLPMTFKWALSEQDGAAISALARLEAGRRAIALAQVGQRERAAQTLRALAARGGGEHLHGVMVVADRIGAAQLALELERRLYPSGGHDSAAYPIPHWQPEGDFSADRALIYAVMRQESRFNPHAISRAGARGVMQLMPGTARLAARRLGSDDAHRWADPAVNIKLGQFYLQMLLSDANVGGDLFRCLAAWNAGPGNLERWVNGVAETDDPLLFIELIPFRETRDFIERVLANLWIYRHRLGQVDPSLDALAAGEWPAYVALDRHGVEYARRWAP